MKKILLSISLALLVAGCVSTPEGKGLFIPHQTVTATGQTNTVYTVNPGVTSKLETAQQIAQIIPGPGRAIADAVLGGIIGALGCIARIKSNKSKLLPVVINGIEAAGDAAAPVKQSIRNVALTSGVQGRLHAEVQRITNA